MIYRGKLRSAGTRTNLELTLMGMVDRAREYGEKLYFNEGDRDQNTWMIQAIMEEYVLANDLYDKLQAAYLAVTRRQIDVYFTASDMMGNSAKIISYPNFSSAVHGTIGVRKAKFPIPHGVLHGSNNVTPEDAADVLMGASEYLEKASGKLTGKVSLRIYDPYVLQKVHASGTHPMITPTNTFFIGGNYTFDDMGGYYYKPKKCLMSEDIGVLTAASNKYIDGNTLTAELLTMTVGEVTAKQNYVAVCMATLQGVISSYENQLAKFRKGILQIAKKSKPEFRVTKEAREMPELFLFHYSDGIVVTCGRASARVQHVRTFHFDALRKYRREGSVIMTSPRTRLVVRALAKENTFNYQHGVTALWNDGQAFSSTQLEPALGL